MLAADTDTSTEYAGNGYWWLRSLGCDCYDIPYVYGNGRVYQYDGCVDIECVAVLPALHLNLKVSLDAIAASMWSCAGTVTANGSDFGSALPTPGTEPSSKPDVKPSFAPDTGTTFAPGYLPPIPRTPPSAPPDAGSIEKVSAVKLKQKKQSATVSWKKVSGATGYQICYSTSKKWKNKKQTQPDQRKEGAFFWEACNFRLF